MLAQPDSYRNAAFVAVTGSRSFVVAQRGAAPTPLTLPDLGAEGATALEKRYHLVLLDDDEHSYGYVVEMLGRLFGYGKNKSFAIAAMVDHQGRAILETSDYDHVSRNQHRIHAYGPDPRIQTCVGSMSAVVEEAP